MRRDGTFEGKSLGVAGVAYRLLEIEPEPSLTDSVTLVATLEDEAEFEAMTVRDGGVVKISGKSSPVADVIGNLGPSVGLLGRLLGRKRTNARPATLELKLRVPPGFDIAIRQGGVGAIRIGKVAGRLDLDLSGCETVKAQGGGRLDLESSSTGDVSVDSVSGSAELRLCSTGSVAVRNVDVDVLKIESSSTGSVVVVEGRAGRLSLDASGVGRIEVGARIEGDAEIETSSVGDVVVTRVEGKVEHDVSGVGVLKVNGVNLEGL